MGEDEPLAPDKQPWFGGLTAEPNLDQAARRVVSGAGEIARRVTTLCLVARVAAGGDQDMAKVIVFHERWRAEGYRAMLELLVTKAKLRPGLSFERATDLLLLFVGPDVYQVLVGGHGWSHEEWVDWTVSTLVEHTFGRAVS